MNAFPPTNRGVPGAADRPGGWRAQFARPTGPLGWVAGWLMAGTNAPMNRMVAALLDVRPADRVLEIGFGPGELIHLLAHRAGAGAVAGVDPSAVMVARATRRNRRFVRGGRVELRQGTVSRLPYPDGVFDKVCAVNSAQFWPAPLADLREVRRVLRPGGLLVVGLRLRDPSRRFMRSVGFTTEDVAGLRALLDRAGFDDVRAATGRLSRESVTCLLARR